jgi:8-oxo-dGTP diphosphatase
MIRPDRAGDAMTPDFHGAKAAILIGDDLLITLRDDRPDIPYPNLWDLPAGGREGDETPEQTVLREIREEVGLLIPDDRIIWRRVFPSHSRDNAPGWFFVIRLPAGAAADIVFGDEGQGWRLTPPADFLTRTDAIPFLQQRLQVWLDEQA